ncbi:MAG: replicative DNA helicase [Firmicutes bacterium]|nr:replicative DNA helicase [Bacillota bacterium]
MAERIPPHNRDAEQTTLGAAMLNKDALADIIDIVKPQDFYDPAHKEIYEAIVELFRRSIAVDIVTVCEELTRRGTLEIAGGRVYVASLPAGVPSAANAAGYAKIVAEKAVLRRLIAAADEIREQSFAEGTDTEIILDTAEKSIFEIAQQRQTRDYSHIKDIMLANLEMIDQAIKSGGAVGVPTGFKELDKTTGGLHKSDLIIIAARPGVGKSSLALTMALNAAKQANASILFFNLEMSREQLGQRLLSMESAVELNRIRNGQIERNDWQRINLATDVLSRTNIVIDDTPGITMLEMKNKCRRMRAEHGLDLIIIDYLQLMSTEAENRQQEISKISRQMKLLAREMDCPVIALSQLSRSVEQREDKHPRLSDLRDSGAIEQDADIVMFLSRESNDQESETRNVCDLDLAKHRNGGTGRFKLAWVERYTKFTDLTQDEF